MPYFEVYSKKNFVSSFKHFANFYTTKSHTHTYVDTEWKMLKFCWEISPWLSSTCSVISFHFLFVYVSAFIAGFSCLTRHLLFYCVQVGIGDHASWFYAVLDVSCLSFSGSLLHQLRYFSCTLLLFFSFFLWVFQWL